MTWSTLCDIRQNILQSLFWSIIIWALIQYHRHRFYQYKISNCGDKTVVRWSYLHNGISYTGKMTSLYWISPLVTWRTDPFFKTQIARWYAFIPLFIHHKLHSHINFDCRTLFTFLYDINQADLQLPWNVSIFSTLECSFVTNTKSPKTQVFWWCHAHLLFHLLCERVTNLYTNFKESCI